MFFNLNNIPKNECQNQSGPTFFEPYSDSFTVTQAPALLGESTAQMVNPQKIMTNAIITAENSISFLPLHYVGIDSPV